MDWFHPKCYVNPPPTSSPPFVVAIADMFLFLRPMGRTSVISDICEICCCPTAMKLKIGC